MEEATFLEGIADDIFTDESCDVDSIEAGEDITDIAALDDVVTSADNIEKIATVSESLEAYTDRIMSMVSTEAWDVRTSQQFRIGADNILKASGLNVDTSFLDLSTEAVEQKIGIGARMKDFLAKLWEAFKGMLGTFIDKMGYLIESYGKTWRAVRKMADTLGREARTNAGAPIKPFFEGQAKWSSYLDLNGTVTDGPSAIRKATDGLNSLGFAWIKAFSSASVKYHGQAMNGTKFDMADVSVLSLPLPAGQNVWPGGYILEVVVDKEKPGGALLNASIHVKHEAKSVDKVPVLNTQQVNELSKDLREMSEIMRDIASEMNNASRELSRMRSQMKVEKVQVSPTIVSKLISKMVLGPRVILPIAGGLAQKAFIHGNKSLKMHKQ